MDVGSIHKSIMYIYFELNFYNIQITVVLFSWLVFFMKSDIHITYIFSVIIGSVIQMYYQLRIQFFFNKLNYIVVCQHAITQYKIP